MKAIRKTNKKVSFKLKAVVVIAIVVAIATFYFSIKFSRSSKDNYKSFYFSEKIETPKCNYITGFYESEILVKLYTSSTDQNIYYTTDGSEPNSESNIYTHPFPINDRTESRNYLSEIPTSPRWKPPIGYVSKATVVRAITVDKKNGKSKELVRTFFINESNKKYTLPVIFITVNQKDLFGFNKGIYVLGNNYIDKDNYIRKNIPLDLPWWEYPSNYLMRGMDSERDAYIEFVEPNGKLGFASNVGLRINGNATRGFAQKSLRVCFREKYGNAKLTYDLFANQKNNQFNSFILRNSGNDWNKTMFRDALMQSLFQNTFIDIQNYRSSIVFINGEYWGIHNIRERFDDNYLANKYHLNKDSITILELTGKLFQGKKDDEDSFRELLDFVKKNDLSIDKNYEYVKSRIDIMSFMDFIIANVYFCNSDWPNNNVKFWRYDSQADSLFARDGRWRWMLYDTDWGFAYNSMSMPESNLLDKATKVGSVGVLFNGLLKNETFKDGFLARFQYHLNSTFKTSNVVHKINDIEHTLQPEIQEHINRWRAIESNAVWLSNVDALRDFAIQRPQFQVSQLNAFFNLKGDKQITLKN